MTADDMMMLAFAAYWLIKMAALGALLLNARADPPSAKRRPRRPYEYVPRIPFD